MSEGEDRLARLARQEQEWAQRAERAQALAAQAYARLLTLAQGETGQSGRAAKFLAATYNSVGYHFDLSELRAVDVEISDDMLTCLDALRWGKADLHTLVPGGARRVQAIIIAWGFKPASWQ